VLFALKEQINEGVKIRRLSKDRLPIVPPVEDVIHHPANCMSCGSGHNLKITNTSRDSQKLIKISTTKKNGDGHRFPSTKIA
jgi:hypothetical protein